MSAGPPGEIHTAADLAGMQPGEIASEQWTSGLRSEIKGIWPRIAEALERIADAMEAETEPSLTCGRCGMPGGGNPACPDCSHSDVRRPLDPGAMAQPSMKVDEPVLYDQETDDAPLPQFCAMTRRSSTHGPMQCQYVPGHKEDHHYAPRSWLLEHPTPMPPMS